MRKESRFGWNDELFPGLPAFLPSFSVFLSSSLPSWSFTRIPSSEKSLLLFQLLKRAALRRPVASLSLVFPDAFKPTPVVGAFSDQLPFPPSPTTLRQLPLLPARGRGSWRSKRWNFWLKHRRRCGRGGHDESVHANSTEPVRVSWLSAIKVAGSDCHLNVCENVAAVLSFDERNDGLTELGSEAKGCFSTTCFAVTSRCAKRDARNIRRLRVNYAARRNYLPLSPLMKQFLTPTLLRSDEWAGG